jgi:ketosteroid isomerase-like protein
MRPTPIFLLLFASSLCASNLLYACDLQAEKVGEITGVKTTTTPDGVVRIGWPRKDVGVLVDGLSLKPFMGLGSWAAFQKTEHGAMVMGDTVVFEDEVNPAIDAAFEHGLEVTALHNHFFFDKPKVYFMHISGEGCPDKLAEGVRAVWDAVKKVRSESPQPASNFGGDVPQAGELDAEQIAEKVGTKGILEDGVYKITIGRQASMHGANFGGSMGLTTWAAFAGTNDSAAIDGDFAMTAAEVQPVLRALRKNRINIVALHNHMVSEEPAYYFVHFWGKGPAEKLANGFREAIDAQAADGQKSNSGAADEVRKLEQKLDEAVIKGDVEFFKRVLADNFTHTSQSGRTRTREQWLSGRKPGVSSYTALNTDSLDVRLLGHAALVTGRISPEGTESDGSPIEGSYRFIRVWEKRGDDWRLVTFQGTKVEQD